MTVFVDDPVFRLRPTPCFEPTRVSVPTVWSRGFGLTSSWSGQLASDSTTFINRWALTLKKDSLCPNVAFYYFHCKSGMLISSNLKKMFCLITCIASDAGPSKLASYNVTFYPCHFLSLRRVFFIIRGDYLPTFSVLVIYPARCILTYSGVILLVRYFG